MPWRCSAWKRRCVRRVRSRSGSCRSRSPPGCAWPLRWMSPRTVLVFDFGGGTLDVTVMRVGGRRATSSRRPGMPIGGDLLDEDVMDRRLLRYFGEHLHWGPQQLPMPQHILDTVRRWYTIPELNDPGTLRFLRDLERERQARHATAGARAPLAGAWQPRLAALP